MNTNLDLEQFRLDVADGIATVIFDRPPVNAQNRKTREELIRVFDAIGRMRAMSILRSTITASSM